MGDWSQMGTLMYRACRNSGEGDINCYWPVRMLWTMMQMMLKMTLIHKQREMGRVMRMRSAERQVRTKAHGPGPSGSAENLLMIFVPQKVKVNQRARALRVG